MKKFKEKTEVVQGMGSLKLLEELKGEKVCIVTDSTMLELKMVNKVTDIFKNIDVKYEIFSEVEPDPSFDIVYKGLRHIIKNKPTVLVAVGGGSAIDAAKAIMFFCLKMKENLMGIEKIKKPHFIAIPTTSGTGSEVTSYSVISDKEKQKKFPIVDDLMVPDVAILDAEFTKSIPSGITADTGIDVLTHCLEAYVAKEASDFTDGLVEKGVSIVFEYLLKAYENGGDLEAREKMHNASCMAGIAFNNAGLGINHSLAHSLGSYFKIPHGRSNALLLPYVIEFNSKENPLIMSKYAHLAEKIGFPATTNEQGMKSLIKGINVLKEAMNIPQTISEVGVKEKDFQCVLKEMSEIALEDICTGGNPKKVTSKELEKIYQEAYRG
ncbi:1-propanol dehydrogenase PduQ [Proteinivorax tanatarense]|uniref:1-propanol dehydrogenase PduQ n=1 Tax=Proteinivorax tanatarense TaxID=1260629 RepID=A0AAU7VJH8_9FIRM